MISKFQDSDIVPPPPLPQNYNDAGEIRTVKKKRTTVTEEAKKKVLSVASMSSLREELSPDSDKRQSEMSDHRTQSMSLLQSHASLLSSSKIEDKPEEEDIQADALVDLLKSTLANIPNSTLLVATIEQLGQYIKRLENKLNQHKS
jgi:hypothetical protein